MTAPKQISIKGTISKKGLLWCASINLIRVTSNGMTPSKCLDSILASIMELSGNVDMKLTARVHDNSEFHITSAEPETFMSFIRDRIALNHDHEDVLSRLGEYVLEDS
jgi:hypothetical protein